MNNEVARRLYYHLPDQGITKTDEKLDVEVQLPEGGGGGGGEGKRVPLWGGAFPYRPP